jgi:ribosomal protection tetracycline resistance protein
MAIVTIGILAHVDAGKTTLTERVLFESGVISALGSVDKGTTQTDALELERARGISIKSAVVSFQLNTLKVNLIDTPGHADFVAEVARSLEVLDGVVLVVSAVEGVQAQTRRLVQVVRSAGLPLLVFVNKIDRLGARGAALLDDLRRKLKLRPVAMNVPFAVGERSAGVAPCDPGDAKWREAVTDALAESSERVIEAFDRSDGDLGWSFLEPELRAQTARGEIAPVYFGSAITGAGVGHLLDGVACLLPPAVEMDASPLSGRVFKIARRPSGEKIVYARLFTGTLTVRQRLPVHRGDEAFEERVTGIDRFESGTTIAAESAAGEIVCLHGLRGVRIGDQLGEPVADRGPARGFAAPPLESVVRPRDPAEVLTLRAALETLAEQDPLISLRQRNQEGEISVRLYGEVQKEVIADTLAREFGVDASFGPSRTVCIERPAGIGASHDIIGTRGNPFFATIGFRIEPGEPGGGVDYRRELGALPLAFYRAIEETVHDALTQGLHAWEVTDCVVTLTHAGFWSPLSTASDFRKLTPLVLLDALRQAGTVVCEPVETLELEIPENAYGAVCGALIQARATIRASVLDGAGYRIVCEIPTAELRGVEMRLPALTGGDGGWDSTPAGYVPVAGDPPSRARTGPNPLNRTHYLAELARG